MSHPGNGAASRAQRQPETFRSLGDHTRQIARETEVLATALRDTADDVERYLAAQATQRPFATLGVAAGVGYVLGGGLSTRLTVLLLGAATRLVTAVAARELSARILRRDATTGDSL